MKIFLDTSSLFKLYHQETGTQELEKIFELAKITHIFLSEITKLEFSSTVWKKVRTKEIKESEAIETINLFENDFTKFTFIATDSLILEQARNLISKYGKEGLRTLDSIQLSSCVALINEADVFFAADKLLNTLIKMEGLQTEMPNL
jgi:predicted nucleic acid-binding protein